MGRVNHLLFAGRGGKRSVVTVYMYCTYVSWLLVGQRDMREGEGGASTQNVLPFILHTAIV